MHHREYVEVMITRRLCKTKDTDIVVPDLQFSELSFHLKPLMERMACAQERALKGFCHEDLESFMQLKLHQVLRRGQYDFNQPPEKVFYIAFKNLFRDIKRMSELAVRDCMAEDALDYAVELNTNFDISTQT